LEQEVETLKQNLILNKFVLHIVFLLFTFTGISQDLYDHQLNEDKWSTLKEGLDYGFEKDEPVDSENDSDNASERTSDSKPKRTYAPLRFNQNTFGLNWLGWTFGIIIGLALIGFIIYIIINNDNSSVKSINPEDYFENTPPADIPLSELERRLKETLENCDYRGAIRIYYLFILKDLSIKQWVIWEKEKTNMHYLREMSGKPEFDDFNKTISYFEFVWYGKRKIDQYQFQTIQPYFTNLLQKLGVE
jgi:hypothetical protein